MKCPVCQSKTKVIQSRHKDNRVRRTRECEECLTRFETFEGINFNSLPDYVKAKIVDIGATSKVYRL